MNFKKRVNGSWVDTPNYIHNTSTDTTTTPADIYANATTATVGLKGQTVQSTTPTPDNPIQPQETGERTGNLFDYSAITTGYRIQWTNGAPYADDTAIMSDYIPVTEGDYTLNISSIIIGYAADKSYIGVYHSEETWGKFPSDPISSFTVLSNTNVEFVRLLTYGIYVPITDALMLNEGSTALPYEPYGIKIPILSASTTTSVYLGEVETTRRIKKLVLDGTEKWAKGNYPPTGGYQFFVPKPSDIANSPDWIITHFVKGNVLNGSEFASYLSLYPEASILPENATANDFKAWVATQYAAGTPVCVWYVLAEPETGIVNEPLRKIGDYADSVSGITIPTIAGANTLSVGTTLQPSEVTVNYKGWHPVADVHEREDGNDNYIPDLNTLTTTVSNCVIESVSNNTLVLSGNGYTGSSFSQIISNDVMMPSNLIGKTVTLSGSITWSSEGNITPRVTIMMHRSGSTDYNVSIYQGVFTQTFEVPSDATSYALLFRIDQNRSEYVGTARVTYTNIELKEQPHWT